MTDQLKEGPQQEPTHSHLSIPIECPKCGADRVACDIYAHRTLAIAPRDQGLLDFRYSGLSAAACPQCGYVELFANQPMQLRPNPK